MNNPRIVTIGGGTGTYTALMGLKHFSRNITAIVTMADDGGSSGRLRDEFGHLPPGDTRRGLVALSDDRQVSLRSLFEYRFDKGYGLNGHSFGNLFLTALAELTGSMESAIVEASRLLNVRGQVLPVTTDNTRLMAELEDGTLIRGEHNIDVRTVKPELRIRRVFLSPEAGAYAAAAEAIRNADILVLGPGDLYTSLIPNLLVEGIPQAIAECRGTRILVCNLMTKHGETDGFKASDFISQVMAYLGGSASIDCLIANNTEFSPSVRAEYAREQAHPVVVDQERCRSMVPQLEVGDLVVKGPLVRHDSRKLAEMIVRAHETRMAQAGRGTAGIRRHHTPANVESTGQAPLTDGDAALKVTGSWGRPMKNIYVMGSGYVGLVTGACFADMGHQVTCVDIDESKVASLNRGEMPIYEPDLEPLVLKGLRAGSLRFTTSLDGLDETTDFVFMCVGTPATADGGVDLQYLRAAYGAIGQRLQGPTVIVNKSSVPPGTTDMMNALLNGMLNGHGPARVVANPEFLREGHAVSDFMAPNRVVVGSADREAAKAVAELYRPLNAPMMFTDAKTAEMIKFASNAFLATKLTFVNEIAALCERAGIDVTDVSKGIGMDPRIGMDYLKAGLGYGGSCLPKDTAILSSQFAEHGYEPQLLNAVREVNESIPQRLVDRVEAALGTLHGAEVGVLGLAFKSDTDDIRHSPAIEVMRELQARGAEVRYYDPKAKHRADTFERPVTAAPGVDEAARGCDAVIVATEWPQFKLMDLARLRMAMRGNVLADGRNILVPAECVAAGFRYIGVGRIEMGMVAQPAPALA